MQARLKKILASCLDVKEDLINRDFSAANIKGWCSNLQDKIVFSIEKEFDIEFDESELMLADSFPLLSEVIASKLS